MYKLTFGIYKGLTIKEIYNADKFYMGYLIYYNKFNVNMLSDFLDKFLCCDSYMVYREQLNYIYFNDNIYNPENLTLN